jgi:hypothetical protein
LVAPGIESRKSGLSARNSDYWTAEAVSGHPYGSIIDTMKIIQLERKGKYFKHPGKISHIRNK